jgi:hypothetical protein
VSKLFGRHRGVLDELAEGRSAFVEEDCEYALGTWSIPLADKILQARTYRWEFAIDLVNKQRAQLR